MGLPTASGLVVGGRLVLVGLAARETSGAASATFRVRDGTVVGTSQLVVPYQLAAGESVRDQFSPYPILFNSGVFVEVVAGAIEGSCWVITEADVDPDAWLRFLAGQVFGGESMAIGVTP